MKIKEGLKNTKKNVAMWCGTYGKKILLVCAGLGLTYIGYKTGSDLTMFKTSTGLERLHKDGFLQFNDPTTGRKDISVKECTEALERRKEK